jgi:hypothetical protein
MNLKRATEVIEAFGPCSEVYECLTPAEVVEASRGSSARSWCKLELAVEDVRADRRCIDGPEPYEDWKRMEAGIIERLKAIGIVV